MKLIFCFPFVICTIILPAMVRRDQGMVKADCTPTEAWTYDTVAQAKERLASDLACAYDHLVSPFQILNSSNTLTVSLYIHRLKLDEKSCTVDMIGDMSWMWQDPRLRWNPESYADIKQIALNEFQIWIPDFEYNNAMQREWSEHTPLRCSVESTGEVFCNPVYTFTADCLKNTRLWPFDEYNCAFELKKGNDFREYRIIPESNTTDLLVKKSTSDSWSVVGAKQLASPNPDFGITSIKYTIHLSRSNYVHISSISVPAVVLSCLTVVQLLIDMQSAGRSILLATNIICLCLYLQQLGVTVAQDGNGQSPLIVIFFRDLLFINGLIGVYSVVLRNLSQRGTSPPSWISDASAWLLRRVPVSARASLLLADELPEDEEGDSEVRKEDSEGNNLAWFKLTRIFDRLLLFTIAVVLIIMLIALIP